MFRESVDGCVPSGLLGIVHRQGLVEHHDVLVAPQGHPVRVQEAGRLCFLPDNVVPEEFLVGHNHGGGEGTLPKQENRAVWLDDALVLRPKLFWRDDGVPGVLGGAIGQVAENHIYRFAFDLGQTLQAVYIVNSVSFHINASHF